MITNSKKRSDLKKTSGLSIPDLRFIEGQTNCFKKRSEKLFTFFKTVENILQLFFQAAISIPDDDTNPNRSPSQMVISALQMVIWVIFWDSVWGFQLLYDDEIFIVRWGQ